MTTATQEEERHILKHDEAEAEVEVVIWPTGEVEVYITMQGDGTASFNSKVWDDVVAFVAAARDCTQ